MKKTPKHSGASLPTCTINDIQDLTVIPLWHASEPSLAALFRCSRAHVYRHALRGEIPTVKIGRRIYVSVPALLGLLGAIAAAERAAAESGDAA